jgi:hypothetical protein
MRVEFDGDVMTITTDVVPKGEDRREVFRSRLRGIITKLEGEISRLMTDEQIAEEIAGIKRRQAATQTKFPTITNTEPTKP